MPSSSALFCKTAKSLKDVPRPQCMEKSVHAVNTNSPEAKANLLNEKEFEDVGKRVNKHWNTSESTNHGYHGNNNRNYDAEESNNFSTNVRKYVK